MNAYRLGLLCVVAASFFSSTGGLFVRLVESADAWQVLFYRSLIFSLAILLFLALRHGRETLGTFRATGRPGLLIAGALALAFICYIQALFLTTVATVVFIVSCSPFFAALFGWIFLREAVGWGLGLAMAAALLGVAIMAGEGLALGAPLGSLLALGSCIAYATTLVALRRGRSVDMLPACCLAGLFAAVISAVMAPGSFLSGLVISWHDFQVAAALGVFQLAFQYILLTLASRSVPAAEIALTGRLQLILAPLWVWLLVEEVPSDTTLLGGAIVLSAILVQGLRALRKERRGGG